MPEELSFDEVEGLLKNLYGGEDVEVYEKSFGAVNSTYIVGVDGEKKILKICTNDYFEEGFMNEPHVQRHVTKKTSVPVPSVEKIDLTCENYKHPFFIQEYIEGYELVETNKKLDDLIQETGEILGNLHRESEFKNYGFLESGKGAIRVKERENWGDFLYEIIEERLDGMQGFRFEDLVPVIERTIKKHKPGEITRNPVLIHQDFSPQNIIVDRGVEAVLDWGGAVSGDPAYDYYNAKSAFRSLLGEKIKDKKVVNLFKKGYSSEINIDEDFENLGDLYRFLSHIKPLWAFPELKKGLDDREIDEFEEELRQKFWELKEKIV